MTLAASCFLVFLLPLSAFLLFRSRHVQSQPPQLLSPIQTSISLNFFPFSPLVRSLALASGSILSISGVHGIVSAVTGGSGISNYSLVVAILEYLGQALAFASVLAALHAAHTAWLEECNFTLYPLAQRPRRCHVFAISVSRLLVPVLLLLLLFTFALHLAVLFTKSTLLFPIVPPLLTLLFVALPPIPLFYAWRGSPRLTAAQLLAALACIWDIVAKVAPAQKVAWEICQSITIFSWTAALMVITTQPANMLDHPPTALPMSPFSDTDTEFFSFPARSRCRNKTRSISPRFNIIPLSRPHAYALSATHSPTDTMSSLNTPAPTYPSPTLPTYPYSYPNPYSYSYSSPAFNADRDHNHAYAHTKKDSLSHTHRAPSCYDLYPGGPAIMTASALPPVEDFLSLSDPFSSPPPSATTVSFFPENGAGTKEGGGGRAQSYLQAQSLKSHVSSASLGGAGQKEKYRGLGLGHPPNILRINVDANTDERTGAINPHERSIRKVPSRARSESALRLYADTTVYNVTTLPTLNWDRMIPNRNRQLVPFPSLSPSPSTLTPISGDRLAFPMSGGNMRSISLNGLGGRNRGGHGGLMGVPTSHRVRTSSSSSGSETEKFAYFMRENGFLREIVQSLPRDHEAERVYTAGSRNGSGEESNSDGIEGASREVSSGVEVEESGDTITGDEDGMVDVDLNEVRRFEFDSGLNNDGRSFGGLEELGRTSTPVSASPLSNSTPISPSFSSSPPFLTPSPSLSREEPSPRLNLTPSPHHSISWIEYSDHRDSSGLDGMDTPPKRRHHRRMSESSLPSASPSSRSSATPGTTRARHRSHSLTYDDSIISDTTFWSTRSRSRSQSGGTVTFGPEPRAGIDSDGGNPGGGPNFTSRIAATPTPPPPSPRSKSPSLTSL
ncbi:hypothetical protein BOTBODRAFT_60337 [Botryobasidium botryosum FD-172 SS1]|uniref:Uncharacterized protein n=1 Tax=Botryobasidium botryosum (strain FD-172 SS1) TaxID=930990 RepID=A0A067M4Z0_BOTB1|nr:hypothetical protein BOTBODRAFT_60337 [Botryobasidium botryosum FD-172 SS1]